MATNHCGAKTGFGGFAKELLTYLYKTGKYDLTLYAAGMTWEHPDFQRWPWKIYGTLPTDPKDIEQLNRDPNLARAANYGDYLADKVVQTVRPDIFFASEDLWGVNFYQNKSWWNKIPCIIHTTIDSRPILPIGVELAKNCPLFFSWADFATKDLNKMGLANVKTLRGTVDSSVYRRLPDPTRQELRAKFRIPQDAFCFGMLARNQLRKSFINILHAYKAFKTNNPHIKNTRVLFFTHFSEGWNIPAACDEIGVDKNEVLATYKCRATGRYYVMPFNGQDLDNPETGTNKSLVTVNVADGLTTEQVNEWYNLLDVYVHAFTSGGMERPVHEAKLAELVTLVTDYSCGEDLCVPEAASLPLEWDSYYEPGTQFIKATTRPHSIVKQLEKFLKLPESKKRDMGRKARQWVLDNFSIEVIGKRFEELFDSLPFSDYDFDFTNTAVSPDAPVANIPDDPTWIKSLYKNILARDVPDTDEGLLYWLQTLRNGAPRQSVEEYFRQVARNEAGKGGNNTDQLAKILGPEPAEDRVLISIPESLGDCLYVTSLLRDARELYTDKKIYVATKGAFLDVFRPLVGDKIDYAIEWRPEFDNAALLEGALGQKKYFQIMLNVHIDTQRFINYRHNGEDKSEIKLEY